MQNLLILISTLLVLSAPAVYIHSIFKGQTKPHRTTRFVLLVITVLSTAALWGDRSSAAFWLALASAIESSVVFIVSLRRGMGGWSRVDVACLIIAMIGVVLWQVSGQPMIGLVASIVADYVGMIPALIKTYKMPETEDWRFFAMGTAAGILSIFALGTYSAFTLSYPVYIALINGVMVGLILRPRAKA